MDREIQAFGKEKVKRFSPARGAIGGERGDAADAHAVTVGLLNALHRPCEIATPALTVGDLLGAVQAGADLDLMFGEELAQLVVQEPEVALQGDFISAATQTLLKPLQRLSPEVVPCLQGLAAVERDLDLSLPALLGDSGHEVQSGFHHFGRHGRALVRPEAVGAFSRTGQGRDQHEVGLAAERCNIAARWAGLFSGRFRPVSNNLIGW